MTALLDAALAYAAKGWRVIPLHSIRPTPGGPVCSCGKSDFAEHVDAGKHPRVRKPEAGWGSVDPAQIRAWWGRWPDANIGIATGQGLAVLDLDDRDGPCMAELRALVGQYGPLPPTPVVATGRGSHIYLAGDMPGSKTVGSILVRGEGGYVVAPPSNHKSGAVYRWLAGPAEVGLAAWPEWLRLHIEKTGTAGKVTPARASFPEPPSYLKQRLSCRISEGASVETYVWSPELEAEVRSALQAFPSSCKRKPWLDVGMALKGLAWFRDGADIGFELWEWWSALCAEKYTPEDVRIRWNSFGLKAVAKPITIATLFKMAREAGWSGVTAPESKPAGMNGTHALPSALLGAVGTPIRWADTDDDGHPRATCTNAGIAIEHLGVVCRKDTFHEKMIVGGHAIQAWAGDLSDDVIHMLRKVIKRTYRVDPGEKNVRDASIQLCLENQFNPVVEYLARVQAGWDQRSRVASWVVDYLGASDTPLNREIGRLMLIAAVRRARQPGCKFDQIIVMEGREGTMKSSAVRVLAGEGNFSDQNVLAASDKEQQEALTGVWLHEIAELAGMRRAEIERVKQFASRTEDRARPAYGRLRVDRPRTAVMIATTNEKTYLQSDTGNRRFWPIETGRIALAELERDRDQLWGEAATQEAAGKSLTLDPTLWGAAGEEQERRRAADPWEAQVLNLVSGQDSVSILEVLQKGFHMALYEIGQAESNRLARILHRLGYERFRENPDASGYRAWKYRKSGTVGQ